ncbi:MAG: hypothetical protein NC206_00780 [Bacteroides sp.]|nr:hypothetical protein [Roseburia sp.]MCM1345609.1 hypothetical protein [Bacteroides sp.]MCM1420756.1 hypothetical protein [Bacteroides sp.]
MANTNQQNLGKWAALIWALLLYFIMHEGIKMLYALCAGASVQVSFVSLKYEAAVDVFSMTHSQQCVFWLIGSVFTTVSGYIMLLFTDRILHYRKHWIHAFDYYLTIVLLVLDPVYLGIASLMMEGGDMSGIKTVMNEQVVRLMAELVAIANVFVIVKYFLPKHRNAWNTGALQDTCK